MVQEIIGFARSSFFFVSFNFSATSSFFNLLCFLKPKSSSLLCRWILMGLVGGENFFDFMILRLIHLHSSEKNTAEKGDVTYASECLPTRPSSPLLIGVSYHLPGLIIDYWRGHKHRTAPFLILYFISFHPFFTKKTKDGILFRMWARKNTAKKRADQLFAWFLRKKGKFCPILPVSCRVKEGGNGGTVICIF